MSIVLALLPRCRNLLGAALVVLALWAQALAPAAALQMRAVAADPLRGAVICGQAVAADVDDDGIERPAPAASAHVLCQLCCAGAMSPIGPFAEPPSHALRWQAVTWPIPPPVALRPPTGRPGQPRAPPTPV